MEIRYRTGLWSSSDKKFDDPKGLTNVRPFFLFISHTNHLAALVVAGDEAEVGGGELEVFSQEADNGLIGEASLGWRFNLNLIAIRPQRFYLILLTVGHNLNLDVHSLQYILNLC